MVDTQGMMQAMDELYLVNVDTISYVQVGEHCEVRIPEVQMERRRKRERLLTDYYDF